MLNVGRCTSGSSLSSILSRPMRCTTGTFAHFNLQCGTVLATRIYRGHMQGAFDSRREVEVADSTSCRCSFKIFVWSQSVPMFIGIIGTYFMRFFTIFFLLIMEILFFRYSKHCHHHHLHVSLVLLIIVVLYIFLLLIKLSIMMKLTLKMKPSATVVLFYYCNIIINNKSVLLLWYHGI